ncbi:hypothetical protein BCS71_09775 [Vibrio lentus]
MELQTLTTSPRGFMGRLRLILYDYMVKCMKELAKVEPDIDALLPWNFKH